MGTTQAVNNRITTSMIAKKSQHNKDDKTPLKLQSLNNSMVNKRSSLSESQILSKSIYQSNALVKSRFSNMNLNISTFNNNKLKENKQKICTFHFSY